ncbi:acetylxylan esterase, partial [Piromyces finnis]
TKVYAEPDPDFHIYLAFGQSNMEGQAAVEENEKTVDKRFQFIPTVEGCKNRTMGEWYDAIPPLPRCNGKAGIVDYFGRKMVKELPENIRIGIVAVAVSGANILLFDKDKYEEYVDIVDFEWYVNIMNSYGRNPYGRLIDMAKIAQKDGVIKGILLHQGENNINDEKWPEYVKKVYNNILEDLSLKSEEVPILVGEMARTELCGKAGEFNDIVKKLPDVLPTAHIISSKGLKPMKDCLHFSKEAYIELGERFANEMLSI